MADSRWSFLPKSVSAHLNSRSDIENAQPNIHTPTRSKSISKSPAPRNQIDRRGQVSAIRRTALKSRRNEAEEEEGSNQHVKVVVRIRPTKEYCWTVKKLSDDSYSVRDRHFTFDSVLDSLHYQDDVFQQIGVPLVRDALSGYNTCVLSYGQNGSGKTYTMWGPAGSMLEDPSPKGEQGLAPRIFQMLFSEIEREKMKSDINYQCRCSFLEIYNGQISDLIDQTQRNLKIKDDAKNGTYVENLTAEYVDSYEDVAQILMKGLSSRKVGATSTSFQSSRSHVILSFIIESWSKGASTRCFNTTRTSRINLVDLAGVGTNVRDATKHSVEEEKFLKKSLSELGHVVDALAKNIHPGISDRSLHKTSCLTHLLQESLGGNSKLTILCNIFPSDKNTKRTMSTLRFGERAKSMGNKPLINEISEEDVNDLSDQIRLLKEELTRAKADCHSVGSKDNHFGAKSARENLNQLRVSLNRSLMLPKIDIDEEEITVDEHDVKELHQQIKSFRGSFSEKQKKLPVYRESVSSSFVTAFGESELMDDDEIFSEEVEAEEKDMDESFKELDGDSAATLTKSTEKSRITEFASANNMSINPCRQSLVLQEPIQSESPKIRNSLRKSIALSSSCFRNQNSLAQSIKSSCLAESQHIRASLRGSKIFTGSTESLAASLRRGLEIIENPLNPASNRCSVSLSSDNLTTQPSTEILQDEQLPPSPLCPSCRQKSDRLLEVVEGDGYHQMEGLSEKQQELQNLCTEQAAKIEQLTRLVEQQKHQTVNETEQFSSANENQLLSCNDVVELDQAKQIPNEDSKKTNIDTGEKEALLKEIEDLKSKLQKPVTMSTNELRSSLLARSFQLRNKNAEKDIEEERLKCTEMESEWISLTDELRVEIETQRSRAEKAETQLKQEKLSTEELEDALQRAVLGHARFVEHYTELQEKYNDLGSRYKATGEWITELKKAVAKAGKKGCGSRFAKSLATELSALRVEKERERDLLKKENVSLKIQLRDTAEAVHTAGEVLVRLREAEQSASVAEENFNEVEEENEKLKKKMEKLKRRHKLEMATIKQNLKNNTLPESALRPLHQRNLEIEEEGM
ncbi:Kinesin motor family protein [Raphanus sativus]|uniref:Kinesin-like protein KIN-12F isoform X2 n=2 Tax=Raphanus sativus TaxID=3726 RepID=A0A6J0P964_RAPSA|nr:kinesin-like protein KIN-12F isoform X2 [Raphanus sativus]XP_056853508.1 kinesin-like protein KIN-12F isoform X2 [Raphanus sativus]KAJ4869996.1 Kinesin motor family protein [Raphanus sativus]KAJ4871333.1 Kinesin motor family protein [Raphanus sativus]